jgi:nucleoside phosphorylase
MPSSATAAARSSVLAVILVVAATARELGLVDGAEKLACGIGPVEAAAATARALAERRPGAVLHVGVAGSHSLDPPALVLGSESIYCDVRAAVPVVDRVTPDADLLATLRRALPEAHVVPIGTSARVGGTSGCDVEAMEGFAVLRAAELSGVPAVELRAVANRIAEPDRARWRFDDALAALADAVPRAVEALSASPAARG